MNSFFTSRTAATVCLAILTLTQLATSANAGFERFYQGSPDFAINALEQVDASTFQATICNEGDMGSGPGQITIVLKSNEGQLEQRTYKNVNLASGTCQLYLIQAVDWYPVASQRKVTITATISWSGSNRDLKSANNKINLLPKRARADATTASVRQNLVSTDPVYDLWGDSSNTWQDSNDLERTNSSYPYSNSAYSDSNYNSYYYSNSNNPNGDFSPASPTWAMRQGAQNLIYIYSSSGHGDWYNYHNGNDGYTYTSCSEYNDSDRSNNGYCPKQSYCTKGSYNNSTGGYDWNCNQGNNGHNGGYWGGGYRRQPDLYLSNLKQNGSRSELIATVCNQGDSMKDSRQITLRESTGNANTTAATFMQLQRGGCADVYINISSFPSYSYVKSYLFYTEIDIYNAVEEVREDNNASYWRLVIN